MSIEKSSFILYQGYRKHLSLLSDADRGKLLMALFDYAEGGKLPEFDGAAGMAFSFIQDQMDRDANKYAAVCERNRKNGSKGGRPSKVNESETNPKEPKESERLFQKPKKPDNEYDNDTDNDNDNDNGDDKTISELHINPETAGIKKTKKKTTHPKEESYFPNDEKLNNVFLDFIDMRRKIKSPMTDRAITTMLNKLIKLDNETAIRMLEQSILNNWKDIYPLKENSSNSGRTGTQRAKECLEGWGNE